MKNRVRLEKEVLPQLYSIYKDHWKIRNAILYGKDIAFNIIANLEQMKADLLRVIELAKEIEGEA